jgi:hypothetical protein
MRIFLATASSNKIVYCIVSFIFFFWSCFDSGSVVCTFTLVAQALIYALGPFWVFPFASDRPAVLCGALGVSPRLGFLGCCRGNVCGRGLSGIALAVPCHTLHSRA